MLGLVLVAFTVPGLAEDIDEIEQLGSAEEDSAIEAGDVKGWSFTEDAVNLPDYPDFDKLMPVQIDASFGAFDFFIDPGSLAIGRDGVVLVTTVITSSRGGKNVVFDGYRCDTREYKTFAYGTSNNTFYALTDPQWKQIFRSTGTSQDFRRELVTTYFCDTFREAMPREEILRLIKYPTFRNDDERMF